jgi:hypothetical protein
MIANPEVDDGLQESLATLDAFRHVGQNGSFIRRSPDDVLTHVLSTKSVQLEIGRRDLAFLQVSIHRPVSAA